MSSQQGYLLEKPLRTHLLPSGLYTEKPEPDAMSHPQICPPTEYKTVH